MRVAKPARTTTSKPTAETWITAQPIARTAAGLNLSKVATEGVSIPPFLVSEVQNGKVVLVLGAGASFGATHPKGIEPPSGRDLAKLLATEFLGGAHANDSLSSVADMAIAAADIRRVQRFVAEQFRQFGPGNHHMLLPTFRWYGLATLNYDEIVEKAYEKKGERLYTSARATPIAASFI